MPKKAHHIPDSIKKRDGIVRDTASSLTGIIAL